MGWNPKVFSHNAAKPFINAAVNKENILIPSHVSQSWISTSHTSTCFMLPGAVFLKFGQNFGYYLFQFNSVQLLSRVQLFATPWTAARQASLSITNSQSLLRLMSIESVRPSNHLVLCRPLLLLPPIFPSIGIFSSESALRMRWPKYWSFSSNISPSNEHPGLISFRMDWLDLLAVQGTLKSLLQHYSSKIICLKEWKDDCNFKSWVRREVPFCYPENQSVYEKKKWGAFPRIPNLTESRLSLWLSYSQLAQDHVAGYCEWPGCSPPWFSKTHCHLKELLCLRVTVLCFAVFCCILLWEPVAVFCLLGVSAVGRDCCHFLSCTFVSEGALCPSQQLCSVSDYCLPICSLNCCGAE